MGTADEEQHLSAVAQIANRVDRSSARKRGTGGRVVAPRARDERKRRPARVPFTLLDAIAAALKGWVRRERERRELSDLSDRDLHDLGLTRADILRESQKVLW